MKLNPRLAALPQVDAWPRRRIAWLGGALIVVIAALAGYDMLRSYRQTIARTERELDVQARVIAEQTTRSLQAIDTVLRHLAEQHRRGVLQRLDPDELHAYLKEQAVGLVQIEGLSMFGPDGRGLGSSVLTPAEIVKIDVAKVPTYYRLREEPQLRTMVGTTMRSMHNGNWVFPIGRRLEGPGGEFLGTVGASGRVDYFQSFYRDAYPDPGTRIALLHRNTTLMARHPAADEALGKKFPLLTELMAKAASGVTVTRNTSPLDGVDRFAALRPVPDHPLEVLVTRDAASVLAPWRAQAIGSAWRTLALGAMAALLIAMVMRQLARVAAARASLAVSEQRYALAAAGSDVGVWDWDLVAGTAYESRRARELQGLPLEPETQPLDELRGLLTYHPDDAAVRKGAMQAHLDGATPHYEVEYRVRRADGRYCWIHVRALCIRDAAGKPLRIAGSVSDIDARKHAEAALRQSEERYALAMTGSNEGHWLWDIPAGQIYVSAKLAELFGIEGGAQTLPDHEYFARLPLHPDDRERVHHNRNEHVAGRTPRLDHEFRIVVPGSGEVRWMHTRAQCFRDAVGKPLRLAGSTVDATQRKRAEQALRESEQRFAVAVAGSDDGIWEWDYVKGLAFGSQRGREIIGLPPGPEVQPLDAWYAEMAGRLHPDDAARRDAAIEDHLAGRKDAYEGDFRVRHGDGWRWVHIHGRCMRDADGKPLRMAGSASDIDARKRAEEALRLSEQRFAVAVAGSDDGIWECDYTTGQAFASQRGREIIGLAPGPDVQPLQAWSDEMARQLHPDDLPRRNAAIAEHLAGRTPAYVGQYRVRHADGSWRWIHVHGRCERDEQGRPLRMAGSTSDIDDRKRTEEALRQSEERYALAMAGSSGGHWVWDTATDALFVSDKVNELFGLPREHDAGTRSAFFAAVALHPDDRERVDALGRDLVSGRIERADYEFRIVLAHGERWILTRAQRFDDRDGAGLRIAGVSVDITERKRAELERQRLEEQLRQAQKLEAIGTLAGGIAHDFNNILSAILGYGELAQKSAPEGTPLRRHIDASIAAGQRAKSLVERILAFSRSGMGERVPVHVQSVVEEALDAVAGSLPPGVRLARRLAAGDAGVLGDATQIHQVVMNLCANAVQAMKSEGVLDAALDLYTLAAPLAVTTNTLPAGDYLRLAIADSGSGIAPELLARIFDPFFTTKEIGVGTGLGLSLVHGIVTDLGGGIAVESRPGAGSRFTVYLPARTTVAPPAAAGPDPSERGDGQAVLLVDDEEALVRLGEEALAEIGYEPVGYTSAAAALDALRAEPSRFDILLTDEAMPGLTGTELARAARALRPDLPVVLASGYVTPALRERARAAGVADVLCKPLAAADVARALAAALRGLNTMAK